MRMSLNIKDGMKNYIKEKFINSSITLAIIYTVGHILIAMQCNFYITGANIELAALDALIEPIINGVWFYLLHTLHRFYSNNKLNLSSGTN